jgi:hypothetical protein
MFCSSNGKWNFFSDFCGFCVPLWRNSVDTDCLLMLGEEGLHADL